MNISIVTSLKTQDKENIILLLYCLSRTDGVIYKRIYY